MKTPTPENENATASRTDKAAVCDALVRAPNEYRPELLTVKKDYIYAALYAVQNGLDYARECLITHDSNLGRTTLKNRTWAERMEEDIRHMESTLTNLRLFTNHRLSDTEKHK